jgi:hypothetical protein
MCLTYVYLKVVIPFMTNLNKFLSNILCSGYFLIGSYLPRTRMLVWWRNASFATCEVFAFVPRILLNNLSAAALDDYHYMEIDTSDYGARFTLLTLVPSRRVMVYFTGNFLEIIQSLVVKNVNLATYLEAGLNLLISLDVTRFYAYSHSSMTFPSSFIIFHVWCCVSFTGEKYII